MDLLREQKFRSGYACGDAPTDRLRYQSLADVSERQKDHRIKTGPTNHRISQTDHRQFSTTTAKPDSMDPRAGAANMAEYSDGLREGQIEENVLGIC